jgi:hypothetical protein
LRKCGEFLRLSGKACVFLLASAFFFVCASHAEPFDCTGDHCGIAIDAPYPNIVIGVVDGVATSGQAAAILSRAQQLGLLRVFPSDSAAFAAKIQPISIRMADGRSLTVLAATWETRFPGFKVGQLVHFAPHRGIREAPRPNDSYWAGIGCIELLCGVGDTACQQGYKSGLYRVADGAELDASGQHVVSGGAVISTLSARVKTDVP